MKMHDAQKAKTLAIAVFFLLFFTAFSSAGYAITISGIGSEYYVGDTVSFTVKDTIGGKCQYYKDCEAVVYLCSESEYAEHVEFSGSKFNRDSTYKVSASFSVTNDMLGGSSSKSCKFEAHLYCSSGQTCTGGYTYWNGDWGSKSWTAKKSACTPDTPTISLSGVSGSSSGVTFDVKIRNKQCSGKIYDYKVYLDDVASDPRLLYPGIPEQSTWEDDDHISKNLAHGDHKLKACLDSDYGGDCDTDYFTVAAPQICTPGTKRCNGNNIEQCDYYGYNWLQLETCQYGCNSTAFTCSSSPSQIIIPLNSTILQNEPPCPPHDTQTITQDCTRVLEIRQQIADGEWKRIKTVSGGAAVTIWLASCTGCALLWGTCETVVGCAAFMISCGACFADPFAAGLGINYLRATSVSSWLDSTMAEELAGGAAIISEEKPVSGQYATATYVKNGIQHKDAIVWETPTKAASYETTAVANFAGGAELVQFADQFGVNIQFSSLSQENIPKMTSLFVDGKFASVIDSVKTRFKVGDNLQQLVKNMVFEDTFPSLPDSWAYSNYPRGEIGFAISKIRAISLDDADFVGWIIEYFAKHELDHEVIGAAYEFKMRGPFDEYLADLSWSRTSSGAEKTAFDGRLARFLTSYDKVGVYVDHSLTGDELRWDYVFDAARISNLADEVGAPAAKQKAINDIAGLYGEQGLKELEIATANFKTWGDAFIEGLKRGDSPETVKSGMNALVPLSAAIVIPDTPQDPIIIDPPAKSCTIQDVCTTQKQCHTKRYGFLNLKKKKVCENVQVCTPQQICK